MKSIITNLIFLFVGLHSYCQIKLSPEVINDFSFSYYYQYKFQNNGSVRACAFLAGRRIGYGLVDIEVAVENMTKDNKFREELYKIIFELYKGDKEFLTLNLISIGMKATNAKKLSQYVFAKYSKQPIYNEESTRQPTKNMDLILNSPSKILNYSYRNLIDSLNRNHIVYKKDSAIVDETFIGFNIKTADGEYFILENYSIGSYEFEISESFEIVARYYIQREAKIKKHESGYYLFYYKGVIIQILEHSDVSTSITYNKSPH
jgi:hypothetical protein